MITKDTDGWTALLQTKEFLALPKTFETFLVIFKPRQISARSWNDPNEVKNAQQGHEKKMVEECSLKQLFFFRILEMLDHEARRVKSRRKYWFLKMLGNFQGGY